MIFWSFRPSRKIIISDDFQKRVSCIFRANHFWKCKTLKILKSQTNFLPSRPKSLKNSPVSLNDNMKFWNKTNQNSRQLKDFTRLDNDALVKRLTVTSLIDSHIEQPVTSLWKCGANQWAPRLRGLTVMSALIASDRSNHVQSN